MKLQFKFREEAAEAARQRLLRELNEQGAKAVRRLFPDETDTELSTLYIVDFAEHDTGLALLQLLNTSKAVEFAEKEVRRKLIR